MSITNFDEENAESESRYREQEDCQDRNITTGDLLMENSQRCKPACPHKTRVVDKRCSNRRNCVDAFVSTLPDQMNCSDGNENCDHEKCRKIRRLPDSPSEGIPSEFEVQRDVSVLLVRATDRPAISIVSASICDVPQNVKTEGYARDRHGPPSTTYGEYCHGDGHDGHADRLKTDCKGR